MKILKTRSIPTSSNDGISIAIFAPPSSPFLSQSSSPLSLCSLSLSVCVLVCAFFFFIVKNGPERRKGGTGVYVWRVVVVYMWYAFLELLLAGGG